MLPLTIDNNNDDSNYSKKQKNSGGSYQKLLLCFLIFLVGWYGPELYKPTAEQIASRPIPYQTLSVGQGQEEIVVLDFRYNQPYVYPSTISSSFLVKTGVWIPLSIIGIISYLFKQQRVGGYKITCVFLVAIGISECITNVLKFWVRRPRPNFYAHCEFDIVTKTCLAQTHKRLVESQLSFPSGHTSLSFCSTTVLVWWFWNHVVIRQNTNKTLIYRMLSILLFWGWSTFVGVSRIVDYWHHPSDVLAGCMLGVTCATITYHAFFTTTATS